VRVDAGALLDLIARTAAAGEPLPPVLRRDGSRRGEAVAAALERGATIPQALRGVLDSRLIAYFEAPGADAEKSALLAGQELLLRRRRWELLRLAIGYPIVCCVLFAGIGLWVDAHPTFGLDPAGFLLLIPGTVLVALLPALPLIAPALAARLPWLCRWRVHLQRERLFRRAGLAARWRLPEARLLSLLGDDLASVAPILGGENAEDHCAALADYHAAAALRAVRRLSTAMACGWYLVAAALALAVYLGVADAYFSFLDELARE